MEWKLCECGREFQYKESMVFKLGKEIDMTPVLCEDCAADRAEPDPDKEMLDSIDGI